MSLNLRLQHLLDDSRVRYETLTHPDALTSRAISRESHIPGVCAAKVVVARDTEGEYLMAVLPETRTLDLARLRRAAHRRGLSLATEAEVERLFPDCELGAMPPFGRLYGMPVFVDECFPRHGGLAFQGGTHHQAVLMRYRDFERLATPTVAEICAEGGMAS